MGSENVDLSRTVRHHFAMRSRTVTHQVGRKREIQTSRANSHPKFSQTITSEQWICGKRSKTETGTSAHDVGSTRRSHAMQTDHDMQLDSFLFSEENDVQSRFYRTMGGPYRGKLLKFGESVHVHLPEVGKGSGNPAPKLADRWKPRRSAGQERPHGPSIWSELTKELYTREACDDSPSTAGQKKKFEQLSKHHRSRSRRQ